MPRATHFILPFEIELDRKSSVTLDEQLAAALRSAILRGDLCPGDRLPPARSLCETLGLSRATVNAAYARLIAQDLVTARAGRGSFVAPRLPEGAQVTTLSNENTDVETPHGTPKSVSSTAAYCRKAITDLLPQKNIPLAVVCAREGVSPGKDFMRIALSVTKKHLYDQVYAHPAGLPELREAIARTSARLRGTRCTADQVIITSGSQLGLMLTLKALFDPGQKVWFEDPCYPLLTGAGTIYGIDPVSVPVDSEGIIVSEGIRKAPDARGVYVTPSHQCPLGMQMSLARRRELVQWADKAGAWIIEDDYDSELRYGGNLPYPCLQGMDTAGEHVIYVGTFSKMIFPGMRLGYLIAPKELTDIFLGLRLIVDRQSNELSQKIVAEYINEGLYEPHVRRMRNTFEVRRNYLIEVCRRELGEWGVITSGDQGMHVVFAFHDKTINDFAVEQACLQNGVEVRAVSGFYRTLEPVRGLMLGFGFFTEDQILSAVNRIGYVLRSQFGANKA